MPSVDLENEAVALLTNRDALAKMWSLGLRAVHFDRLDTKAAFEFATKYWRDSSFETAPTKKALQDNVDSIVIKDPEESPVYVVNELKRKYAARLATKAILEAGETIRSDPQSTISKLSDALWGIRVKTKERKNSTDLISDVQVRRQKYEARAKRAEAGILGESLGFDEIDEMTSGIRPGELVVLAAGQKVGKTWYSLQIAKRAIEQHHSCLYFTLEMNTDEMADRFEALLSEVSYNRLDKGRLTVKEAKALYDAQENEKNLGRIQFIKPQFGDRTVENMIRIAKDFEPDIMIIDQLSFMESNRGMSRSEQAASVVLELKSAISQDEDWMVPTVLLAQFNRGGANAGENVEATSLGLTSELERTADSVIALSQSKEQRASNAIILQILNARRYDLGKFLLKRELYEKTKFTFIKTMNENEVDSEESSKN